MELQQNSANRLFSLITQFRSKPGGSTNNGQLTIDVWCQVFGVGQDVILWNIHDLLTLVCDVEQKIKCDSKILNKVRHLSWVRHIQQSFLPGILNQSAYTTAMQRFGVENPAMIALEFCVEALAKSAPEVTITAEDLQQLQEEGQSLFQEVDKSIESPELKEFLLELLNAFNNGISSYRIRGVKGLDDALNEILGRLTRFKKKSDHLSTSDKSVFSKALNYFKKGADLVDQANKLKDGWILGNEAFEQISTVISSQ